MYQIGFTTTADQAVSILSSDPYLYLYINQYTSVSGSSISNGNDHEVYYFQGLYDTHPVYYYYVNDEHLKHVSDGTYDRYFFYDALGRCVKRRPTTTDTGNTTYYIYDGEKPIVEYTSTGIVGRNVYGKGIDEILMRTNPGVNNGDPIYYADDHEGSVTHLINGCTTPSTQTGNVLEKYAYDAFGVPTFMDGNGNNLTPNATLYNNRFLFTGREYAATYRGTYVSTFSFYEYRARAYNPNLGRFMSEDPKGFDAGDYNLFRYCHNDPIDSTDPMGLETNYTGLAPREISHLIAELREGVQEALRQAAQQRAYATAYSRGNFEGGTSFIGMANFHMAQTTMQGNYLRSSNYSTLGNAIGRRAEEQLQQNPSEHEELSIISRNKNGTDFIASQPEPQFYNGKTQKNFSNVYNRNDPRQVDPSPPGYRAVANVVAQKLWVPFIDPKDRANIHKTGLDAFIAVPGQSGTNQPIRVRFYNEGNVFPTGY
jgi:RHS repeat-associated protein